MSHLLRVACLALVLGAAACSSSPPKPSTPQPIVTDTEPLGEGLKTLAYAFLGASVVVTLGRLLR